MFISLSSAIGKRSFLVVLLLLAIGRVDAQTVDGYILTINNDSLLVHIQPFKQGLFSVIDPCYKKVAVIDSVGNTKVYTPKDIKGYGYIYKNFRYNFVSKPIEDGSSLFLTPYVTGNKSSLYMYNLVRNLGASVTYTDYYTFEKGNSQTHFSYLFMDSWAW